MEPLRLGRATVLRHSCYVLTQFDDGTSVPAVAQLSAAYRAHAGALGYGATDEGARRMNAEHDLLHSLLALARGYERSEMLWAVAHDDGEAMARLGDEEDLVLAVHCLLHAAPARLRRMRAAIEQLS